MPLSRRRFIALSSAVALASCAAPVAPSASPAAGTSVRRQTLRWGAREITGTLDPQRTSVASANVINNQVFDGLVRLNPDFTRTPELATEWKELNDTTWQFKLRPGVKWHHGDPFTAADVKFTVDWSKDPTSKGIWQSAFAKVSRVDVVDDLTVNFVMTSPDHLLPARFSIYQGGPIMPAKYFKDVGPDAFGQKASGTGIFKVSQFAPGEQVTLTANMEHFTGAPNVDTIIGRAIPESTAAIAALLNGEVDLIGQVPPDQFERINNNPTTKIVSTNLKDLYHYTANQSVPPLNNKLIRQALSLAIDRPSLITNIMRGNASPTNGPIVSGDFAYDASLPPLPYDPAKARALMQEAGYKGELIVVEGKVSTPLGNDQAISEAVVAMFKAVGFNVRLDLLEPSVNSATYANKTAKGLFLGLYSSTLSDPEAMMWRLLRPNGPIDYWDNPAFDRLGQQVEVARDQATRKSLFEQMTKIVLDEMPWIILFEPKLSWGMDRRIQMKTGPSLMLDFHKANLSFTQ
jgi:peptide/nickel transport system substrate-binding protein